MATGASGTVTKQRTVLLVSPYFPPAIGGLEQYVYRLAEQLPTRHDWRVVVATSGERNGHDSCEVTDKFAVYRLAYSVLLSNTPLSGRWLRRLRAIVAQEQPDVINVHLPVPGIADLAALAAGDIPVVVTYHFASMRKGILRYDVPILAYERLAGQLLLRRAVRIICASDASREFLRAYLRKSVVIPPAVDADLFRPAPGGRGKRLLFVSNMTRAHIHKGLGFLLDALADPACADIGLDVVGDGNARQDYEAQCARLGISDRVKFLGRLFGEDLAARYRAAFALVQPSTSDNIPTTIIEAMASGVPVIATRVGSTPTLIDDGVHGWLVDPGSVSALVTAISRLWAAPDRATAFGVAGRAKTESLFTIERQADRTSVILEDALRSGGRGVLAAETSRFGGSAVPSIDGNAQ